MRTGTNGNSLRAEDVKSFLKSLSHVTGLCLSYFPPGSENENLIIGESSFCLQLKANRTSAERCRSFIGNLKKQALEKGEPVFDLCYARMGGVAVPLVCPEGSDLGSVMICGALLHGLTEEHREHLRELAWLTGIDDVDGLVSNAGKAPALTRSRLEALAAFIQSQLLEKAASRNTLEDTTEFLLEKYEELMFFYAVTENIIPEKGSRKAFSVILDKGIQKLEATWGMLLLSGDENPRHLELLESWGHLPPGGKDELEAVFHEPILVCSGPAMIQVDPGNGFGPAHILTIPFRVRNMREGHLVFGFPGPTPVKEAEMRFALALSRQAASVLHAVGLYRDLADLLFSTLGALSSAIDAKDPYTHGHSRRVAEYAVKTARRMGHDPKFLTMLKIAGQLHDFGKIGIREYILGKKGRLDADERRAMEEHPVIGAQILGRFKAFSQIVPGIRHHHERYDGKGYPDGICGDKIPMVGRIIAVADAFDAMTTSRPYRKERNREEAFEELRRNAGTQFDPFIVNAFITALGEENLA